MPKVEYLNYEVIQDRGWVIEDDDLFETAAAADLPDRDYGFFEVPEGEYIENAHQRQVVVSTGPPYSAHVSMPPS